MVSHVSLAGIAAFTVSSVLVVACAGVADLDVKYTGAGADGGPTTANTSSSSSSSSSGSLRNDAGVPIAIYQDAGGIVDPSTLGQPGAACPCDETQGAGCCAGPSGSTCVAEKTACQGAFLRCFGPDVEGSVCCAHRTGGVIETALAGDCSTGASIVCTVDAECPNGVCTIGTCGNVTIGTCDGTPVCP